MAAWTRTLALLVGKPGCRRQIERKVGQGFQGSLKTIKWKI
jgi:hypothetical protein